MHFVLYVVLLWGQGYDSQRKSEISTSYRNINIFFAKSLRFNKENANISPFAGCLKTTVEYGMLNFLQQKKQKLGNVQIKSSTWKRTEAEEV